ncbi:MAG: peptidoglycan DD-metalloendopeptidase family protein [Cellulosilyticaceae bacterium]
MNMNKFKDFTKKYGFYLAVGAVSIGAITAVFLTTGKDNPVSKEQDPYVQAQDVSGSDVAVLPEAEDDVTIISGEVVEKTDVEEVASEVVAEETMPEGTKEVVDEEELTSETFSSTTAPEVEAPYFAEGDTLGWPVAGEVIVPFRDDTTKHWFSTALQQTMRTYGVCISAKEGEGVKAPAKGTIVDIVEDSTTLESTKLVGNVGQVVVMDLGNGYTAEIGLQGGKADKDLLGQVVDASQVIGTVGNGTGPFADLSYNVYMQVKHEGNVIDPTTILSFHEDVAGVDMGHVQE